jgi:hypothetical protein
LIVSAPGVLGNDWAPDGGTSIALVSGVSAGVLVLNADGSFRYVPQADWSGTDRFAYQLTDGDGDSGEATVTIEVAPVDDPVSAVGDAYSVSEGAALEVSAPGVVWNDSAPDGGAFVTLAGGVSNGTLVLNADGSFTYTPNPYWGGVDRFSYRLTDEDGDSGEATVTIEVTPVDDPVSAGDDAYRSSENAMLIVSAPGVLGNDWAPDGGTSIALVSGVSNGALVLNADGSFRYVPQADWSGTDRFAYQLTDVDGDRAEATVTIEVSPGSDPPVAGGDSATVAAGAAVTIDVLANDRDPDGGDLRVVWFSQPAHGVVGSPRNGTVRYTAREGYVGPDVFLYTVRAADGDSAQATVTVTVVAANVPPIAKDDLVMTREGEAVEIDVLANDVDLDGSLDRDSVVIVRLPMDGRVDFANGMLTYTPDPSFYGTDHLTYFVADDQGAKSNLATVTIGVTRGSLSPLAWGDTAFTQANAPVTIDVAANDEDPDGRVVPETVRVTSGPRHGAATVEPDGCVTYVPDRGFVGTDLFAYQVEDDDGNLSNVATVIIEVAGQVGGGGATASLCEGKVVISEVGWAGTATSPRDEWIELRNLGATSVDLSGWTLRWRRTRPTTSADQEGKTIQLAGVLLPSQLSACDQVVHGETSSFEIVRRDDVSWLVVGSSLPTREGYHLLERGSDETIRDASASQVYDEGAHTGLALADEGEALELVNAHGGVVDTANAFHPGEDGWAAGDAAMAASMERTDPLGPDVAENWHTNLGVVTSGVDAGGRPVMATAGGTNSPALEALVFAAGVERTAVPAGKRLDVGLDLSRSDRKQNGWPWILVTRPDLDSAGSGGALDVDGAAFSGRYVDGLYWLTIDTARLTFSGACDIWIVYGAGKVVLVSLDVVEP